MKVSEKITVAKRAIESISRHDDAEQEYVDTALEELAQFVAAEREAMKKRRKTKWQAEMSAAKGKKVG